MPRETPQQDPDGYLRRPAITSRLQARRITSNLGPMPTIKGNRAAISPGAGQHGGVADLLWDDVKCFLDPDLMGSLPDVRVPDLSANSWQDVLDLVVERGWKCQYSEGETVLPLPCAEAALSRPADAECPNLRVWLTADVLAIFRFKIGMIPTLAACAGLGVLLHLAFGIQ